MPNESENFDMSGLIADIINDIKSGKSVLSEESEGFVKEMTENMQASKMSEKTAVTIVSCMMIAYEVCGTDEMRQDIGRALKELTQMNGQHTSVFGGCASYILEISLRRVIRGF